MLNKLVAIVSMFAISVGCSVCVMIYGWGLQPRSWWWIIGVGFFVQVAIYAIVGRLKKEE